MNGDILTNTEYVYSGLVKWGLKRYACRVSYYTTEPLRDLDYVICSIIASSPSGIYDKCSLGIMLGFSMVDNQPEVYYDKSEVLLFEDILALVEEDHLISIQENNVAITELGRISLENNTMYRFFRGWQDIYEHLKFSYPDPDVLLMFPFFKDMGIHTSLQKGPQYWPEDNEISSIIGREPSQLIKRINLLSAENNNIYEAEKEKYFDIDIKKVPVKLFSRDETYFIVVYNGDAIAPIATQLFDLKENTTQKENAILECLFCKLWDDKSAILDYETLEPYFELVDYEELTKDSRTQWRDLRLFGKIVEMANSNCWLNISNNCDIDVLYTHLKDFIDYLDWGIITARTADDFLLEHFNDYPWDLETLSNDTTREVSFIQGLILKAGEYSSEWDWETLGHRLEKEFVLENLQLVNVNLFDYTEDTEQIRAHILDHLDKRWDWAKVEGSFDLTFILENILILQKHLNFTVLFDRVFVDTSWSNVYIRNIAFITAVRTNIDEGGSLSSLLFNQKEYVWSDNLIKIFSSLGLIEWSSTRYSVGFECNPHLNWDKEFFSRNYEHVSTSTGRDYVSSKIIDESVITDFQDFGWNWTNLSKNQNVSTDFVKAHYSLPWDWKVLTERMFGDLKYNNIGHPAFINKWDWVYLSKNLPTEFILDNLTMYANYWDWSTILDRIVTKDKRLDVAWLSSITISINAISNSVSKDATWSYLSEKYTYEEFKDILRKTHHDNRFTWNLSLLYKKKEFDIFKDLSECQDLIDWESLSYSKAFDQHMIYDSNSGIREASWDKDVKQLIIGFEDKWNFLGLSTFESLIDKEWFLTKYSARLDWEYISLHSPIFTTDDKQQLYKIVFSFKQYISFEALSERQDIDIIQIIKNFPKASYNYNSLISNGKWHASISDIKQHPNYKWDWKLLSSSDSFKPTAEFLIRYSDKDWDWHLLSKKDSSKLWSSSSLLMMMVSDEKINSQVDWLTLTGRPYFPVNTSLLSLLPDDCVNWDKLSGSESVMNLLPGLADYLNWQEVSKNKHFPVSDISKLEEYADDLNWNIVCKRDDFVFTNDILEKFSDRIDWTLASSAETIVFSAALVDKYVDYWDWPSLVRNKAFFNKVEIRDRGFLRQENIINFVKAFPDKPHAYHFTHMSNAVRIIKSHTLQSRNKADGIFENSAGINVDNTAKAHGFARFYFISKSPTLFYNECLGKDKNDTKYYSSALNLGLPKCPMPVFFVIDIEELLAKVPDKCYYSNGNMQKRSTKAYKVIDDPHHINADEIYNKYNKEARQQEFLVKDGIDLLPLSSLQICCFDNYQRDMLKSLVGSSPLKDRIITKEDLFERINRQLHFKDTSDTLEITTDYCNAFEFRITYTEGLPPEILNSSSILREKGNNIYMKHYLEIKKDKPFTIYFEVSEPRKGSWLIYTNS